MLDPGRRQEGAVTEARGLMLDQDMSAKEAVETAMKRYDRWVYRGAMRIPKARAGDAPYIDTGAREVLRG